MAARMIVMYRPPADPAAFDRHYQKTHVPLAKQLPGLRSYEVARGPVTVAGGPFHLVGTLEFDDLAAIQAAFASEIGQACAADRRLLAPGDDDVVMVLTEYEAV
ncbi:MAG: EthD family reductase [Patulibacter minatonensis]